ncbi:MAG TPA: DUF4249 domain-containing protein [Chryseosolibacter sp.]
MDRRIAPLFAIVLLSLAIGCVEPFDIPVRNEDVGFLVVDGYINTNTHTATVSLSRAIPLSSSAAFPRELNASVFIEEDGGEEIQLNDLSNGIYERTDMRFVNGKRFRLRLITASRREYTSEYIIAKNTPPIDSLSWSASPEGVTIKLDTEDPENKTKYYRWEFSETWKYDATFSSEYKLEHGFAVPRPPAEQVKTCYASEPSSQIITGSTINFTTDKFVDQEITVIPFLSQKTRLHYSILVKQYALSKEGYDYWQQLSINTESLGGLFDPQPSQLRGNITRSDDSDEPVIGYFDGGSVSEKRLFIEYRELPDYLQVIPINYECRQELMTLDSLHTLDNTYLLTHAVYWDFILVGYNYTPVECADCRQQGGTTQKPSFWPN